MHQRARFNRSPFWPAKTSAALDVMAATMVAAVDQRVADGAGAHLAEGDFGRVLAEITGCTQKCTQI
jgi:hypothetical protein